MSSFKDKETPPGEIETYEMQGEESEGNSLGSVGLYREENEKYAPATPQYTKSDTKPEAVENPKDRSKLALISLCVLLFAIVGSIVVAYRQTSTLREKLENKSDKTEFTEMKENWAEMKEDFEGKLEKKSDRTEFTELKTDCEEMKKGWEELKASIMEEIEKKFKELDLKNEMERLKGEFEAWKKQYPNGEREVKVKEMLGKWDQEWHAAREGENTPETAATERSRLLDFIQKREEYVKGLDQEREEIQAKLEVAKRDENILHRDFAKLQLQLNHLDAVAEKARRIIQFEKEEIAKAI